MRIELLENGKVAALGHAGENGVTCIRADISAWAAEYPDGRGALLLKRPDGQTYPLSAQTENGMLQAVLTATDLAVSGRGQIEAQWREGERVLKSAQYEADVAPSLGEPTGTPDETPPWADEVTAAGTQALTGAAAAFAAQIAAEQSAASAEQTAARIVTNEAARASAEQNRVSAEQARVTAESARGTALNTHMGDKENPHAVTAEQVYAVSYEEAQALTDTQKTRVRLDIGAVGKEDYAVTNGVPGLVGVGYGTTGIVIDSAGHYLKIASAANARIDDKSTSMPITPINLDYAVKAGLTTNTLPLTDAEKAAACGWMGAVRNGQMALIEKIIVGYSLTTAQPSDWATNYTAYFTRSGEPTDESMTYVAVTGDSAPAWAAGTYYGYDAAASEIVHRDTNPDGSPYGYAGFVVEIDMTQMADASLSGFVYAKALRNGQLVSVTSNYFLALGSSGRKYMCLWISPSMGKWYSNGLYMASKDYLYPTYNANGMIDVYFSTESNIAESPAVNCIDMNVPLKSNAIVKLYGVTA